MTRNSGLGAVAPSLPSVYETGTAGPSGTTGPGHRSEYRTIVGTGSDTTQSRIRPTREEKRRLARYGGTWDTGRPNGTVFMLTRRQRDTRIVRGYSRGTYVVGAGA